jgi:acyl carrier protein phosphodiesterase
VAVGLPVCCAPGARAATGLHNNRTAPRERRRGGAPLFTRHEATMNHLAHLVLAGEHPDDRLGALLGDHLKGRAVLETLRPGLARGVRLHRRIDAWSDADPAVRGLLERFEPPWRRYGGIVLDVLFDRELSLRWDALVGGSRDAFGRDIDRLLAAHRHEFPPRLVRFSIWAEAVGLWGRLDDRALLAEIFARIAARHGRREPLARGLELLDAHEAAIGRAFDALFPRLQRRAQDFLAGSD